MIQIVINHDIETVGANEFYLSGGAAIQTLLSEHAENF
jgi:hypothetical protein